MAPPGGEARPLVPNGAQGPGVVPPEQELVQRQTVPLIGGEPGQEEPSSVAGEKDERNHYLSTVAVHHKGFDSDGALGRLCSGVLVHPRVVLTSGNCLCKKRTVSPSVGGVTTVIDATACASTAMVSTFAYERPGPEGAGRAYESQESVGHVRVHPALKVRLNERGNIVASEADLAAIVLNEPYDDVSPIALAETEVRPGESLVMVSYGYNDIANLGSGYRRFRENSITRAPASGGRVVFDPRSRRIYKGDSGGACLRTTEHGEVVAGILTGPLGQEASFTSTFSYRDWVAAEIRRGADERAGVPRGGR